MWIDRRWSDLRGPLARPPSGLKLRSERSVNPILGVAPGDERETRDWLTSSQLQARGHTGEPLTRPLSRDAPLEEANKAGHDELLRWAQERSRPATAAAKLGAQRRKEPALCMSGSGVLLVEAREPPAAQPRPQSSKPRPPPRAEDLDALVRHKMLVRAQRQRQRAGESSRSLDVINPLCVAAIRTSVTMGGTRHQTVQ